MQLRRPRRTRFHEVAALLGAAAYRLTPRLKPPKRARSGPQGSAKMAANAGAITAGDACRDLAGLRHVSSFVLTPSGSGRHPTGFSRCLALHVTSTRDGVYVAKVFLSGPDIAGVLLEFVQC